MTITRVKEKVIRVIYHARKSLLFNKDNLWVKKDNPHFDVIMGNYSGADFRQLVEFYQLISSLRNLVSKTLTCREMAV